MQCEWAFVFSNASSSTAKCDHVDIYQWKVLFSYAWEGEQDFWHGCGDEIFKKSLTSLPQSQFHNLCFLVNVNNMHTYVKEPCCDMGRLRARQNNVTQNMIKRTFQSASSTESCGRFHTHGNWAVILSINKWFCSSSRIASSISWSISIWSADCMTVLGSGADCAVAVAPCCILSLAAVACVQGTASNRVYFSFSYSFLAIKIRLKSMKTVIVIMWSYFLVWEKVAFLHMLSNVYTSFSSKSPIVE